MSYTHPGPFLWRGFPASKFTFFFFLRRSAIRHFGVVGSRLPDVRVQVTPTSHFDWPSLSVALRTRLPEPNIGPPLIASIGTIFHDQQSPWPS